MALEVHGGAEIESLLISIVGTYVRSLVSRLLMNKLTGGYGFLASERRIGPPSGSLVPLCVMWLLFCMAIKMGMNGALTRNVGFFLTLMSLLIIFTWRGLWMGVVMDSRELVVRNFMWSRRINRREVRDFSYGPRVGSRGRHGCICVVLRDGSFVPLDAAAESWWEGPSARSRTARYLNNLRKWLQSQEDELGNQEPRL